ncbi:MAG: hypothetical protein HC914_17880 [Chloroflexaceae bacterium]|nr:hypothetical protein [Chloroflexaceae bacterium]
MKQSATDFNHIVAVLALLAGLLLLYLLRRVLHRWQDPEKIIIYNASAPIATRAVWRRIPLHTQ